jgi:hypothetical protein
MMEGKKKCEQYWVQSLIKPSCKTELRLTSQYVKTCKTELILYTGLYIAVCQDL